MTINGTDAAAVEVMAMRAAWRHLVIEWELSWSERRELLPLGGEERADLPHDTERRMRILIEIGHRLTADAGLCEWLRTPTEFWNWYSPLEVMSGSISDLRRFRLLVEQGLRS